MLQNGTHCGLLASNWNKF
ncbi:hypothetical protein CMV_030820, partial [Castanea mollissima]